MIKSSFAFRLAEFVQVNAPLPGVVFARQQFVSFLPQFEV
jgi:hypothetical protein